MSKALVGIIMGSDSDLPVMSAAIAMCEEFSIAYEVDIVSAHRTPEKLVEYAKNAQDRGLIVIIAGAGGAAHLPGMVAAETALPVIGVPVRSSSLDGMDSLLSIVQMPGGVPVATVAINGAKNAGILAAQIIGTMDNSLREKITAYKLNMKAEVDKKSENLQKLGYKKYLEQMPKKK
ncbi:MAG: N5-carboxyaminoimidazole ribonucleotide mutase [uncultured Sulfurimonas sp.]|nr:MAG: N5-carboxyaminoimidazole ribonucleotide mutase [uncultured Sulfurimonas sp.]CAI6155959.1 MAG: N5-carboxyaminoimidazole ribonucleotide mutase [uncultured Sulfurimonas sp.]